MANVEYDYTKDVNNSKLYREIMESTITTAIAYITAKGVDVEIWFKATLSAEDKTTLDTIVANHTDTPDTEDPVPVDLSNKPIVHETSKPFGLITTFTSQGDDMTDATNIGDGIKMKIDHTSGQDAIEQDIFIDFNCKENRTDIHEGYIMWEDAKFDQISMCIVPNVTPSTGGTDTNYNLYGGIFIIPAAGDGILDVNPADFKLVEMTIHEETRKRSPGFWNADYNSTTHLFENITPAPDGTGIYNMFAAEYPLAKLVNKAMFSGSGFLMLQTADSKELGHGMRVKLSAYTNDADHTWRASCILTLHRTKIA